MEQGTWGIRVDTKDWASLVTWTAGPMPRVWATLMKGQPMPPMWTPEEAWEIGHAIVTAAANAMEGVTPEDAAR